MLNKVHAINAPNIILQIFIIHSFFDVFYAYDDASLL